MIIGYLLAFLASLGSGVGSVLESIGIRRAGAFGGDTDDLGKIGRQPLYITGIPYGVNKAELVEAIAQIVIDRKMPLLLDVKDISTDDVRIELQLKRDAEVDKVMAYLFKHTALQTSFHESLPPTKLRSIGAHSEFTVFAMGENVVATSRA